MRKPVLSSQESLQNGVEVRSLGLRRHMLSNVQPPITEFTFWPLQWSHPPMRGCTLSAHMHSVSRSQVGMQHLAASFSRFYQHKLPVQNKGFHKSSFRQIVLWSHSPSITFCLSPSFLRKPECHIFVLCGNLLIFKFWNCNCKRKEKGRNQTMCETLSELNKVGFLHMSAVISLLPLGLLRLMFKLLLGYVVLKMFQGLWWRNSRRNVLEAAAVLMSLKTSGWGSYAPNTFPWHVHQIGRSSVPTIVRA